MHTAVIRVVECDGFQQLRMWAPGDTEGAVIRESTLTAAAKRPAFRQAMRRVVAHTPCSIPWGMGRVEVTFTPGAVAYIRAHL